MGCQWWHFVYFAYVFEKMNAAKRVCWYCEGDAWGLFLSNLWLAKTVKIMFTFEVKYQSTRWFYTNTAVDRMFIFKLGALS